MTQENNNSHIEQINQRFRRERLLISSGLIFQTLSNQINPISAVELAMHLDLTVFMVRRSLKELERDNLAVQNFQGDWEVVF